jgi:hypothetical protein
MSLLAALLKRKKSEEVFDPNPIETDEMPARPYRVLYADLPFYTDPDCRMEVRGARLVVIQCNDPAQKQRPTECMPVVKRYRPGDIVWWDLDNKKQWQEAWYVNPESGNKEKAWSLSVAFQGRVVRRPPTAAAAGR